MIGQLRSRTREIEKPMTRGRSQTVHHNQQESSFSVYQSIDLNLEDCHFMKISDLKETYDVHYIEYEDDALDALTELSAAKVIGFDGEYRNEQIGGLTYNAPSCLQFGLKSKCYVFNINRLSVYRDLMEKIWDICASPLILKVGQSVCGDLAVIFKYFEAKFGIKKNRTENVKEISQCLFIENSARCTFSLADLSHRFLGKTLRKNQKSISAGGKESLTNELEIEYVALDALVPLHIYHQYRLIIDKSVSSKNVIDIDWVESCFVIDWGLWSKLGQRLINQGYENVHKMEKATHAEILEYFKVNQSHVLVTHDKFLLMSTTIRNKIPYFNDNSVLKAINVAHETAIALRSRRIGQDMMPDLVGMPPRKKLSILSDSFTPSNAISLSHSSACYVKTPY